MANKFKVWVDSPGSVIMDAATFATDTQRSGGFQAGQAASALRVNSALRQANLVVAALMGLVDNSNLDLKSSVSDVQTSISNYLTGLTVTKATNADITTDSTVGDNVVKFAIGNGTVYNKTINNVANATQATYASADTSKGTIEERLTNLGFNEGDATIVDSRFITQCHFYQEGNSTFLNFKFKWPELTNLPATYPSATVIHIATLPSNFRFIHDSDELAIAHVDSVAQYAQHGFLRYYIGRSDIADSRRNIYVAYWRTTDVVNMNIPANTGETFNVSFINSPNVVLSQTYNKKYD